MPTRATADLCSLVERRHHAQRPNPLGQRRELDDGGEVVACGPGLMRDHDGVHDLLGPCVLNLERLLVLDRLWGKGPQQRDRPVRLQIVGKARARRGGAELIGNGSTAVRAGVERRWQRTAELKLERK